MPLVSVIPDKGVNLLADPAALPEGQCALAKNLYPHRQGILGKRYGAGPYLTLLTHTGENYPLAFTISPNSIGSYNFFAFTRRFDGSGCEVVYANDTGGSGVIAASTVDPAQRPKFIAFNDELYLFYGPSYDPSAGPGLIITSPGGVTPTATRFNFNGTNNGFPVGAVGIYRNRFVYANLGPGFEKNIVFSDPFDPQTIGDDVLFANGRSFTVGNADGDRIVALVEMLQTGGTPATSALLVLCEHSAYLVTGEPNLTTDVTDMFGSMEVAQMPLQCGCASAETVVRTPYGTIWASAEDVWTFSQGQLPRKIGTNISPALKNTAPSRQWRWHAAYFNKSYRLAVDSEGASGGPNDPCGDQWWLDLRNGSPVSHDDAKWWGPQQYLIGITSDDVSRGTFCMLQDARTSFPDYLFLAAFVADVGAVLAQADVLKADDDTSGTSPPYAPSYFTPELWPRIDDAGDPEIRKVYQGTAIGCWSSNPTGLEVEVQMDDGASGDTTDICSPGTGFQLDSMHLDETGMSRTYSSLAARPSSPDTQRITGRRMQVRIREVQGLVVDATNDRFVFSYDGAVYTARVAHGVYASQAALLAALVNNGGVDSTVYSMNTAQTGAIDEPFGLVTVTHASDSIRDVTNSFNWFPVFVAVAGSDPLDVAKTVALGKLIGFDTSANPVAATTQTVAVYLATIPTAMLEFDEIAMKYTPLPRRTL